MVGIIVVFLRYSFIAASLRIRLPYFPPPPPSLTSLQILGNKLRHVGKSLSLLKLKPSALRQNFVNVSGNNELDVLYPSAWLGTGTNSLRGRSVFVHNASTPRFQKESSIGGLGSIQGQFTSSCSRLSNGQKREAREPRKKTEVSRILGSIRQKSIFKLLSLDTEKG